MIEIRNVSRRYGNVQALKDVSLMVPKGSVLGLLGQNGAGKTTLLNILTGYLAPTEGEVLIGGYNTLMEPAQARRHIGYLPEQPPLYDEMTVHEYLCFAAELRGVPKCAAVWWGICPRGTVSALVWRRRFAVTPRCLCWTSRPLASTPSKLPKYAA